MKKKNVSKTKQIAAVKNYVACDNCALDAVCRPIKIGGHTLSLVHNIMGRNEPVAAGEYLYCKGEPIRAIYAVTSGTIKIAQKTDTGREQVLGFRFPGELFGEEAIFPKEYTVNAQAIDEASVCRIPILELEDCAENIPSIQQDLIELISRQCFLMQQQMAAYVARNSAEERLAAFLINMLERNAFHSGSQSEISLAMSRDDIANFLGLRRETLSRSLSKLQKLQVIRVDGKVLEILDSKALRLLAHF